MGHSSIVDKKRYHEVIPFSTVLCMYKWVSESILSKKWPPLETKMEFFIRNIKLAEAKGIEK